MAKTPKVSLRVFTGSSMPFHRLSVMEETHTGGYESCIALRCKLAFRNTWAGKISTLISHRTRGEGGGTPRLFISLLPTLFH